MNETVEIGKEELAILQQTAKVANTLWNDSKYGIVMKEAVKEKFPSAAIPEVDILRTARVAGHKAAEIAESAVKKIDERISAFEKSLDSRDEEARRAKDEAEFSREVESTKRKYNLTNEGMQKVFDRMKERNNPDVESAAAWVTDHESKPSVVAGNNYSPQSLNLYGSADGDKEWAELNANPLKYGDKILNEMASDFANGNFNRYKEFGGTL